MVLYSKVILNEEMICWAESSHAQAQSPTRPDPTRPDLSGLRGIEGFPQRLKIHDFTNRRVSSLTVSR